MRTILLPLNGSVTDRWALETGLDVAAPFGAHLTALLPKPEIAEVPVYSSYGATAGFAMLVQNVQAEADKRHAKTLAMLEDVAAGRSIRLGTRPDEPGPTVCLAGPTGDSADLIRRWAAVHDLVVFPRLSDPKETVLSAPSLLKSTLEYCGRAVLVITDILPARFARVAIAWNGSTEGARAVSAALPFLHRANRIIILTAVTSKTDADQGKRLRDYLLRHGLHAEIDIRTADDSVGHELVVGATAHGADLLVTGCYTHSRTRQSLFGGVTHHLLEHCAMPMLMAH